jgi:preprotein translocase subunit SecF
MFDVVGKKTWFLLLSAGFILAAIVSLVVFGLKPGIEFSSGSIMTLRFEQAVDQAELEQSLAELGFENVIIQRTARGDFILRTHELTSEIKTNLEDILAARFGNLDEVEFNSVSPMVASETTRNAAIAVAIAAVGVLLYITWAFRRMPHPFLYGTCAVLALMHDALVAVGVFSLLGGWLTWEINLMFITGVLAVIGYSVNNTVVIFDRIRENLANDRGGSFSAIVNRSVISSLSRSLNTSLTTLIVVLALLFFVGASIRNFAVVLLTGIIAGTYSSLFVAPLLLVIWGKGEPARSRH